MDRELLASRIINEPDRSALGKRIENNVDGIGFLQDMDRQANTAAAGQHDIEIVRPLSETTEAVSFFGNSVKGLPRHGGLDTAARDKAAIAAIVANCHVRAQGSRGAIDDFDQCHEGAPMAGGERLPQKPEYVGGSIRENARLNINLLDAKYLISRH